MGFKKEVREFMAKQNSTGDLVKHLTKLNQDLMDRLMARDFSELKTYSPDYTDDLDKEPEYDATKDETAAGAIIE